MSAKRLGKEYAKFAGTYPDGVESLEMDESSVLMWKGVLAPTAAPYDKNKWEFQLEFPVDYPFKPPKLQMLNPIYHPNFDGDGKVPKADGTQGICLDVINQEKWKPATKVTNILTALVSIINTPEPGHPLCPEIAEQFSNSHAEFLAAAYKHAETAALPR